MATAKEALKDLIAQMEGFVSTKTVVGEAIHIDNTIILPLVDVSMGAGAGARDKDTAGGVGGGVTAKMSPSAVLVIKGVALHNYSNDPQVIEPDERVAQLVIAPYIAADFVEVDTLEDTDRGAGGFGSTGRK